MITENVSTLKINKLTKAQYERELAAGNIDENALYLTPDDTLPISEGGTGATTAAAARTNLGFTYGTEAPTEVPATGNGAVYFFEGGNEEVGASGVVDIEEGGTGATTRDDALINLLGYKPGYCKIVKKADTTDYSTSYNYFDPFYGTTETTSNMGEHIYQDSITLATFGDRTNYTVTGIRIGANVNFVKVAGSVRYANESTSSVAIHTIVYRRRTNEDGTISSAICQTIVDGTAGSTRCSHTINTLVDVQEGDFIGFQSYKGISDRNVDVLHTTYATQMTVQAIG